MSGRPFLQIPGPTNVPDRILRAMHRPVIDHRSPEFAELTLELLPRLAAVFKTEKGKVALFPASGSGAWEAALVNTLSPGDRVLSFQVGQFSALFAQTARNLGYVVDEVGLEWGRPVAPDDVAGRLRPEHKALLVVHNETATGVTSDVAAVRRAMDRAGSQALLLVDAVSSLASIDFRFDEWRVDVAISGSQKGLMLPPGMGIVCAGPRAIAASETATSPRSFFDWRPVLKDEAAGFFPYTPATLLLYGLRESLRMLFEEGLENVFERHRRLAGGVRAAVDAWGLRNVCLDPSAVSNTLTAVYLPEGHDAQDVIARARRFGLSLGGGLGKLRGRAFRIGHLGALNELEVLATLGGTEMALIESGVDVRTGSGADAAERSFLRRAPVAAR